ncbi:MAG TPA: rhodanese-like domain-containing protein [Solirubrobacteraceae bacterium]
MSVSVEVQALVGPDWIAARLGDPSVRVVEVDVSRAGFDAGHIPGAVFWNAYSDLRPVEYRPLDPPAFARLLSRSGIAPDTAVVFYGYGAYLGYWLMRSYGHESVRMMGGPRERWLEAGREWTTEMSAPTPARYAVDSGQSDVVTPAEVLGLIVDPDAVLLDVRSREEFTGERFWPSGGKHEGGRPGHIPAAVWLPLDIARQDPEEIRDLCETAGVRADRHVIVYCTIGNRASQVWFVLKHLLRYQRVSVYYGSWAEWGTTHTMPVQVEPVQP